MVFQLMVNIVQAYNPDGGRQYQKLFMIELQKNKKQTSNNTKTWKL